MDAINQKYAEASLRQQACHAGARDPRADDDGIIRILFIHTCQ